MRTVAVVRPGWTDFDEQRRLIGALELPINSRGESQLPEIIEHLRELPNPPDGIVSGTTQPALGTAASIAAAFGLKARETEELVNLNQGLWQGLTIEETERRMSRVFRQWQEAPETICPPEGEPWEDAVKRVKKGLKKPLRKFESLVIVASEPLASLVSSLLTGEPPDLTNAYSEEPRAPVIEVFERSERDDEFVRVVTNRETQNED